MIPAWSPHCEKAVADAAPHKPTPVGHQLLGGTLRRTQQLLVRRTYVRMAHLISTAEDIAGRSIAVRQCGKHSSEDDLRSQDCRSCSFIGRSYERPNRQDMTGHFLWDGRSSTAARAMYLVPEYPEQAVEDRAKAVPGSHKLATVDCLQSSPRALGRERAFRSTAGFSDTRHGCGAISEFQVLELRARVECSAHTTRQIQDGLQDGLHANQSQSPSALGRRVATTKYTT